MTKEEKALFSKVWKESRRGNSIYKVMPTEKKIIDLLVTRGLLRYISEKYVKVTKEGIGLVKDTEGMYYR
jgi:hypothetical protein